MINRCIQVVRKVEWEAPVYEERIAKKNFIQSFGFVGESVALRRNLQGVNIRQVCTRKGN